MHALHFQHIRATLTFVIAASAIVASSCSSPDSPSGTGTAVINGHVSSASRGRSSSLPTAVNGGATSAITTLTVSINGTNISSTVDGSGNFQLTGVPPGDVTLMFSGAGVNASITLTGVPASAQVNITVSLNGNSAHLEDREDDENDDIDDDDEIK